MIFYSLTQSPLGDITVQANDSGLLGLWFETNATKPESPGQYNPEHPVIKETEQQLALYFAGELSKFDVPVMTSGTPFQQQVWTALCDIPFGQSISYQELANRIGKPKAVRAVGAANGKNPISIIVPCHRVIGKNGKLTGYSGGVERKKRLLELEGLLAVKKDLSIVTQTYSK